MMVSAMKSLWAFFIVDFRFFGYRYWDNVKLKEIFP